MQFNAKDSKDEGRADFPRLELKKDEVARIGLFQTDQWEATVRHFVKGMGYIHCHAIEGAQSVGDLLKIEENGGDPTKCMMCRIAAEQGTDLVSLPMRRFAVRILRYQTDMRGKLLEGDPRFIMLIWIMDNYKYRQIKQIDSEWGDIRKHDLLISCQDEKWQRYTINVAKEVKWAVEPTLAKVKDYLKTEIPKYNLAECLGQTISKDVLTRKFDMIRRRTTPAGKPVDVDAKDVFAGGGGGETVGDDIFDVGGGGEKGFTPQDLDTRSSASPMQEDVDVLKALDLKF